MNFLGIAKSIGKDLGIVGGVAAPIVSIFNPALGAIIGKISTAVVNAEAQMPADGQGPAKQQAVVDSFDQSLAMAQTILRQNGKLLTYNADLLNAAIAAQTASYNAYAALAKSVSITSVIPTPSPAAPTLTK